MAAPLELLVNMHKMRIFKYSTQERDGKPIYRDPTDGKYKEFIIPSFSKIRDIMLQELLENDIKVERCSPYSANIIIRVFKALHYEYEWGMVLNMYGSSCYLKSGIHGWTTSDGINDHLIEWDRHQFMVMLAPDEAPLINGDFVDYFFRIS